LLPTPLKKAKLPNSQQFFFHLEHGCGGRFAKRGEKFPFRIRNTGGTIFATAETKKAANLLERLTASKYGMFFSDLSERNSSRSEVFLSGKYTKGELAPPA
jgi:hypothetical protein